MQNTESSQAGMFIKNFNIIFKYSKVKSRDSFELGSAQVLAT